MRKLMHLNTNIEDDNKIARLSKRAIRVGEKYGVSVAIGRKNDANKPLVVCEFQAIGQTKAFCNGVISEVINTLRKSFGCTLTMVTVETENIPDWIYQYSPLFNEEEPEEGAK